MTDKKIDEPDFARRFPNLASPRFGSHVASASDEFFGAKERLISDAPPVFIADKYDDHGKWMDGWESRRKRDEGHDWCIVELGASGVIHGMEIDTSHFTGNYPPGASLVACAPNADINDPSVWTTILPTVALEGDERQFFAISNDSVWGAVRLNILPDGGVARMRLYGEVAPSWGDADDDALVELSALKNGGRIIAYNDAHYGDLWALLSEGRGKTMGDGWETRRRREPGNDWIIIALAARGTVEAIEIDTAHFKGNFPDSASVEAIDFLGESDAALVDGSAPWVEILQRRKLQADTVHEFSGADISSPKPVTHVRLSIYPDGGVSRFRIFGRRQ
jgi:allantoicase